MELCALSSGSSGNCFYLEDKNNSILVDAGISCRKIIERLNSINKNPENIKAIFLTHEHSDHIRGVDVFARKFEIPIFGTKKTLNSRFICSNQELINEIDSNEILKFGNMQVEAFSKMHLASDPVSYVVNMKDRLGKNKRIGVITDLGKVCKNTSSQLRDLDFVFLESNHDIKMLDEGFYPWHTKKWIKSDLGHLSNSQAALGVLEHASSKLKNIILSHISENNNTNQLALNTFKSLIKERRDLKPELSLSVREFTSRVFSL